MKSIYKPYPKTSKTKGKSIQGKMMMKTCECCGEQPTERNKMVKGISHPVTVSLCSLCYNYHDDEIWIRMTRHLMSRIARKQKEGKWD